MTRRIYSFAPWIFLVLIYRNVRGDLPHVDDSAGTLIVGGVEASPHEFPWLVSIRTSLNDFHLCGGVILDQRTVLTTASCAELFNPSLSSVAAGKHNLSADEEYSQVTQVSSIHLHPDYPGSTDYSNDIAVLKTSSPFSWTQYVAPAPKLYESDFISQESGVICGWGTQREEEISLQENLRKATVKIIESNGDCQLLVGSQLVIEDSMVCISSPNSTTPVDSCTGDQGGPLIITEDDGTVIAGLISFGIGCGRPNMPSFCTRISPYLDFIRRYLET